MDKKHYCTVSGKEIPAARVEALKMLGTPEAQWTCVEHSSVRPRQGIFMGEAGTSEMLLVTKVYDETVRSVFKSADRASQSQSEEPETGGEDKSNFYSSGEMNYYAEGDTGDGETKAPELIKPQ